MAIPRCALVARLAGERAPTAPEGWVKRESRRTASKLQTSVACLAVPAFPRVCQLPHAALCTTIGDRYRTRKVRTVMDRSILIYMDYEIAADAEGYLRADRRERDLTLLRAIRLQSFGRTRLAYPHAERMPASVYARAYILSSNSVRNKSRPTERVPIPCSPTPNCRGHPCSCA